MQQTTPFLSWLVWKRKLLQTLPLSHYKYLVPEGHSMRVGPAPSNHTVNSPLQGCKRGSLCIHTGLTKVTFGYSFHSVNENNAWFAIKLSHPDFLSSAHISIAEWIRFFFLNQLVLSTYRNTWSKNTNEITAAVEKRRKYFHFALNPKQLALYKSYTGTKSNYRIWSCFW